MKRIYICSSLKPDNYSHVTQVLTQLPTNVAYLRPHPAEITALKKEDTVETDVAMIRYADEIWVLGHIGRDSTWEIGFATALNKRIRLLIDDTNRATIEQDWMLLHGKITGRLRIYENVYDFGDQFRTDAEYEPSRT